MTLLPLTSETGVEHDRIAAPSTCTVQAPHNPAPQPNFVPVSSSVSRNTQSKGVSGATFTFFSLPFTRSVKSAIDYRVAKGLDNHPTQSARKVKMDLQSGKRFADKEHIREGQNIGNSQSNDGCSRS